MMGGLIMSDLSENVRISLVIATVATLAVLVVGTPLALALARPKWRGRMLLDVLVNLPLALPPTVVGYYLLLLLGKGGPIGQIARFWGGNVLFTKSAAIVAASLVSLPLFVQAARNALEGVPPELHEAAAIDGASRWITVRRISIPLAWPGIWSGALLAYVRSLGEFGATMMVAGNIPGETQTMALAIYSAVQAGDQQTAHLFSAALTGLAGFSMWIGLRLRSSPRAAKC